MSPARVLRHSAALAWRNLVKFRHTPDQLLDIMLMPVTFVLMFVFLFGNAVSGDWHAYLQFVIPGIAVQALMFATLGTALSLNTDPGLGEDQPGDAALRRHPRTPARYTDPRHGHTVTAVDRRDHPGLRATVSRRVPAPRLETAAAGP